MLNRENKAVLKSLNGEYKKFAKRLAFAVFARCEGNKAINENLAEMFAMLQNAQEQGKPFEAAIPDAEATIRETLLCFPPKRIWRLALILVFSALFVISAAVGGGVLYKKLTPDKPEEPQYWLGGIYEVRYDALSDIIEWSPLNYVSYYVVSVTDPETNKEVELGKTAVSYLRLDSLDSYQIKSCIEKAVSLKRDTINIKIFAKAEDNSYFDYETQLPMRFSIPEEHVYLHRDMLFTKYRLEDGWEKLLSWTALPVIGRTSMPCGKAVLHLWEYNFYGRIDNPEDVLYILEDSEPQNAYNICRELDPTQEQFFRGDYVYTFVLKRNKDSCCKLEISIPNIRDFVGKIPAGKTIFARPSDEKPVAFSAGNDAVLLSTVHVRKNGMYGNRNFFKGTFPIDLSPYVLGDGDRSLYVAENQSEAEEAFYIIDNVIDFEVENFQKTITLAPGYTTLRVNPWEGAPGTGVYLGFDFSILSKKNVEYGFGDPRSETDTNQLTSLTTGSIKPASGLYGGMEEFWYADSKTNDFLITLYVREETQIIVEGKTEGFEDVFHKSPLMNGTVRLKPGFTWVYFIYAYTFLTSDDQFEIDLFNKIPYSEDNLKGYIVYRGGASAAYPQSALIFNPNDYEIEINASEVNMTVVSS